MFYSMNQLFDDILKDVVASQAHTESASSQPLVNLYQKEDKVLLIAEVPGMKTEEVELQVKDKLVTIKGEKKLGYSEDIKAIHAERSDTKFERKFKLPFKIDHDKTQAELKDGVLMVTLERAETDKPHKIDIH